MRNGKIEPRRLDHVMDCCVVRFAVNHGVQELFVFFGNVEVDDTLCTNQLLLEHGLRVGTNEQFISGQREGTRAAEAPDIVFFRIELKVVEYYMLDQVVGRVAQVHEWCRTVPLPVRSSAQEVGQDGSFPSTDHDRVRLDPIVDNSLGV